MRLIFNSTHASLRSNIDLIMPSFSVVTGINGSGKTHLLEVLNNGFARMFENDDVKSGGNSLSCKYIPVNTLSQPVLKNYDADARKKAYISAYDNYRGKGNKRLIITTTRGPREYTASELHLHMLIANKANKNVDSDELTFQDFETYYPLNYNQTDNIFQAKLIEVFRNYAEMKEENEYKSFRAYKGYDPDKPLSEEEFLSIHGPAPWDVVNKLMQDAQFDYTMNNPSTLRRDAPFELELVDKEGLKIQLENLSSGEQVLMSIVIALYNSTSGSQFHRLLLLDEPDAFLHPTMCKNLISLLNEVLVEQYGMKVIMTTHSPTTIALVSDNSIFVMNKTGNKIEKVSKDKALNFLTIGVPSLSINYENRRQVFVESAYDVCFYEKIYEKVKFRIIPDRSLNFIDSGIHTDGTCEHVKEVVNLLSSKGNKSVFGIIDWDNQNDPAKLNSRIKVSGFLKRYSTENYVFDPIYLAAILLRDHIITRESINLHNNETYADFKKLNQRELQGISNYITNRLYDRGNPSETSTSKIKYLNGIEIYVPTWYLQHHGHKLVENIIMEEFPELKCYRSANKLCLYMVEKIIDDIPDFISYDFIDLFSEIQVER